MIADAHSHLDKFRPEELEAVLSDARSAGIELMVTVGMDSETSAGGVAIANAEDDVYAAVGLHPWLAQDYRQGIRIDELRALAARPRVVAIGEIGLDFVENKFTGLSYRDPELRRIQEVAFREQLRLARTLALPVILHSKGAHDVVTRILEDEGMDSVGGCLQFFEGTPDDVARYVELGFSFSVGSSVTFGDPGGWYDTVRTVPADRVAARIRRPVPSLRR